MIPDLIDIGTPAPWSVLPAGIHEATLEEVEARFATTPHRAWLFGGFLRVVEHIRAAGCTTVFLDGSFITAKPHPSDFDGCWDISGVDPMMIDPVLLDFSNMRAAQKAKYFGEMFLIQLPDQPGNLPFFQQEKFSGQRKGILRIVLSQAHHGAQ
ncbi:DUF6932 family protein [Caulobacter sp.]|uniref:DUF6932 family protein n=1 Tax=Caulobacter sp. TaxID=78 RepID=UPI003BAF65FB